MINGIDCRGSHGLLYGLQSEYPTVWIAEQLVAYGMDYRGWRVYGMDYRGWRAYGMGYREWRAYGMGYREWRAYGMDYRRMACLSMDYRGWRAYGMECIGVEGFLYRLQRGRQFNSSIGGFLSSPSRSHKFSNFQSPI
jgi:hypothetical protein